MQKENKQTNSNNYDNDNNKNNLDSDSLSDLEKEIISDKNLKLKSNANGLSLSEAEAEINDEKQEGENSNSKNSKKEKNESLLSSKRIRNESAEDIKHNETNKKLKNNINDVDNDFYKNNREENIPSTKNGAEYNSKEYEAGIATTRGIECPYLGTIKRHLLDFDFEKVCSISLSNLNVYACLVCGKYYQGRGKNTHAYVHSLQENHHLFINLNDEKIICLPEGYEVIDNSLRDIKLNLKPVYSEKEIADIDKEKDIDLIYSSALDGTEYIPGCIGLNNIKKTDYVNVIIQALCRVSPLRDYFLKYDDNATNLKFELNALLIQRFAELIRKIWSPHNFKGHVSPHEFMQAITLASVNKFKIVEQSDSINFLSWFFNSLNDYLMKKNNSSKKTFQGKLLVETFTKVKGSNINESDICNYVEIDGFIYKYEKKIQKFFFLTLDLPKAPLFKDSLENIVIPQISIFSLLKKYDGNTFTEDPIRGVKKRYHIMKLPKFLILYFKRFEKNNFFVEKNTTIINFPLKRLSLEEFTNEETKNKSVRYSLLANIIHDGKSASGSFRSQIKHKILDKWFDIQDLNVNEILAPSVVVSESYIHVYEGSME